MDHSDYIKSNIERRAKRLAELDAEDRDLAAKRESVAKETLTVGAELRVYQDMLTQFQGSTDLVSPPSLPKTLKDRAPSPSAFTISKSWIIVFKGLDQRGKSFDASDVARVGAVNGISLTTPSIRSQFAHYSERGYLRKVMRGKYTITPKGREKFAEAASQIFGESHNENGLPKGSPETGVSAPNFNLVNGGKENA